jgi:hypothetical protein
MTSVRLLPDARSAVLEPVARRSKSLESVIHLNIPSTVTLMQLSCIIMTQQLMQLTCING